MAFLRRSAIRTLCTLLAAGILPAAAEPEPPPPVVAKAWIVVDADTMLPIGGENADQRRPVASTQKLLTALLVCERGGLTETITVDKSDTLVAPSKLGIQTGQKYRRVDLLKGLLIKSGNDLAHCLGRDHSGSEANFARNMTARARSLGMVTSQFRNASGLPDSEQFSTARDMARLAMYIHHHPDPKVRNVILGITRMAETTFSFANGRTVKMTNTNKLLTRLPGCNGMKTGYTNAGGKCLVSSVTRDGHTVIAVVLGSDSKNVWTSSQRLLEWGLRRK